MDKSSRFRLIGWNTLLFIICQAAAIKIASLGKAFLETRGVESPELAWWHFLLMVFGALVFFLILLRLKLEVIFKIFFAVLIIWGGVILFSLFLPVYLAFLPAIALLLLWIFYSRVWVNDLILVNGMVIFGLVFGLCFSPWAVLIILVAMSIYDVYAVHKGKFMQKIVDGMMKSGAIFGFLIPIAKTSDFLASTKEASDDISNVLAGGEREKFSLLGGGDIAFSILMVVSVFADYGLKASLVVAAFGLVGLFLMYGIFILRKWRPMAALPPIALSLIAGFLVVYFLL